MWELIIKIWRFIYSIWDDLSEEAKDKIKSEILNWFESFLSGFYRQYNSARGNKNEED